MLMIRRLTQFARLTRSAILGAAVLSITTLTSLTSTVAFAAANTSTTNAPKATAVSLKPYLARYKLSRSGKERGTAERELVAFNSLYRLRYKSSIQWLIFSDERT